MTNTYTTKLGLAKPANGDVDWHIPINENWDDIDSKLGPLYEDITSGASALTINKNVDANNKSIENVNVLGAVSIKTTAYTLMAATDAIIYSDATATYHNGDWTTKKVITVPSNQSGSVRVSYNVSGGNYNGGVYQARLLLNDNVVTDSLLATYYNSSNSTVVTIAVSGEDVISLQLYGNGDSASNSVFSIGAIVLPTYSDDVTWS